VDGNGAQVLNQFAGCAISWVLAIVGTLIILKICDMTVGLRVTGRRRSKAWMSACTAKKGIYSSRGLDRFP
jgi:ammonia channel protein AmtB